MKHNLFFHLPIYSMFLSFTSFEVFDAYFNYVGIELRIWNGQFHFKCELGIKVVFMCESYW